jgi:hypothetical protein
MNYDSQKNLPLLKSPGRNSQLTLSYSGNLVVSRGISNLLLDHLRVSMSGFTLSYTANMFILMIPYDLCLFQSQSRSHIATDGQWISKSWCRAPSEAHDQIFITFWQLRFCFSGAPFLQRGRVCLLYTCMLLVLASVVFLGSESLGTRDHILLSQIWDFRFRLLLRLAGSRWRYSTPPPHGSGKYYNLSLYSLPTDHAQKTQFYCCIRKTA